MEVPEPRTVSFIGAADIDESIVAFFWFKFMGCERLRRGGFRPGLSSKKGGPSKLKVKKTAALQKS
jgi:hypothetical protein